MNPVPAGGLGDRIEKLRKTRGYTQKSLGAKLGVSDRGVRAWEAGVRHPRRRTLPLLADALGTTCAYLLSGEQEDEGDAPPAPATLERIERTLAKQGQDIEKLSEVLEGVLLAAPKLSPGQAAPATSGRDAHARSMSLELAPAPID